MTEDDMVPDDPDSGHQDNIGQTMIEFSGSEVNVPLGDQAAVEQEAAFSLAAVDTLSSE